LWNIFQKQAALQHAVGVTTAISAPVGVEAVMAVAADAMVEAPVVKVAVAVDGIVAAAMGKDPVVIVRAVKIATRHRLLPGIRERQDSYLPDLEWRQSLRIPLVKSGRLGLKKSKSHAALSQGLLGDQRVRAN
jgi:hypothetical protein